MRREQSRGRFQSKAERNLAHGLGEVRRIASTLELSESVRDQACQLFRSAQNEDLLRGRSIEAIAAASVYGACRCNGLSRLVGEVSELARVAESRVTNAYKTLNEELGFPAEPVSPACSCRASPRTSSAQTRSDNGLERSRNKPKSAVSQRASIRPGVRSGLPLQSGARTEAVGDPT